MRTRGPALVAAALLALAGCGGDEDDDATTGGTSQDTITVSLTDFELDPDSLQLDEPGTVTLRVVNEGDTAHALAVDGGSGEAETASLTPGQSADLVVEVEEGADYELYCPIGNHRGLGMEGTLVVGRPPTDTDEEQRGSYGY
jgi:plastocyanin